MDQTSFVLASIACGLASTCVVLSLWSFIRLSRVEATQTDLDTKLPPKRVRELEQAFDAMTDAFEGLQQKNAEWKQSVHNSVQRMDQIMRRNEKATEQLLTDDGDINPDIVKVPNYEPSSPAGRQLPLEDTVGMSKQKALQLRYNKNRGL